MKVHNPHPHPDLRCVGERSDLRHAGERGDLAFNINRRASSSVLVSPPSDPNYHASLLDRVSQQKAFPSWRGKKSIVSEQSKPAVSALKRQMRNFVGGEHYFSNEHQPGLVQEQLRRPRERRIFCIGDAPVRRPEREPVGVSCVE